MFQFIESIKVKDGKLFNLEYHQARVNRTLAEFYPNYSVVLGAIGVPLNYHQGLYKLRIVYSKFIEKYEFQPYNLKKINNLKIIQVDDLIYNYKFLNRIELSNILNENPQFDEVIICRKGLITDTTFTNLVFEVDNKFYTPESPLLKGTKREKLLNEGIIVIRNIDITSISDYKKIHLINSMIDLGECCVDVENVIY